MTVRVKICGITRREDLLAASDLGADAVGFIVNFPPSPRNLNLEEAAKLVNEAPIFLKTVLVTVPSNIQELKIVYDEVKPDAIQIHGENLFDKKILESEIPGCSFIRALRTTPETIASNLTITRSFQTILLDTYISGKHGGTGTTHDWKMSKKIKQMIHPRRLILAGGLTPDNVQDAIRIVQPYAVDVSTGVEESPGIKDHDKIHSFIKNARNKILD